MPGHVLGLMTGRARLALAAAFGPGTARATRSRMNTGEICNRRVLVCEPELPLVEAAKLMREHHVGSLVVVDRSGRNTEPVAVVTDRDIVVEGVARHPESLVNLRVMDIMTPELVTTRDDEDMVTALERMKSFGIRRMPIVDDDGALVGILTYDDVLQEMVDELQTLTKVVDRAVDEEGRRP
jgi:CBS domain-containing protein